MSYRYVRDGLSSKGEKIPDVPVFYLSIKRAERAFELAGRAIVDTGFDGGLFPNERVILYFEGIEPDDEDEVEVFGEIVPVELYVVDAWLVKERDGRPSREKILKLRPMRVFIPTRPEFIPDEVLIGREALNNITFCLNGAFSRVKV
ncbi:TPA: hypothetical protein EYP44_03710 [Candidatus Bathyarchaeota archaeon]|nr:hypothetical protein [Candidatus Bathyarchaeota archaeon]